MLVELPAAPVNGSIPWSSIASKGWDKKGIIRGVGYETRINVDVPIEFEDASLAGLENVRLLVTNAKYGVWAKRDKNNNSCNGFFMRNVAMQSFHSDIVIARLSGTELTSLENVHIMSGAEYANVTGLLLDSELRSTPAGVGNTCSGHYWKGVHIGIYNSNSAGLKFEGCVTDFRLDGTWLAGAGKPIVVKSRPTFGNVGQVPSRLRIVGLIGEGVPPTLVTLEGTQQVKDLEIHEVFTNSKRYWSNA